MSYNQLLFKAGLVRMGVLFISISLMKAQSLSKSHYRIEVYSRHEMYAGSFPMSSAFPEASAGSIVPTGWGFGGMYIYEIRKHFQIEGGFSLERWKKLYARAGEELRGFVYFGGWRSPPVPYETYYQGQVIKLRIGGALDAGTKVHSRLSAGLNLGSYEAYFGSASGGQRYSEAVSGMGMGSYLRLDIGFPIQTQGIVLMTPSLFAAFDRLAVRNSTFRDFLWVGVNHSITDQLFGIGGYRIGVAVTF
ncbi:MAG: hypothetical protein N2200_09050 [Bacteroidia bacterium]|nr:hypothetical protein [Bacteroidia bacterium]